MGGTSDALVQGDGSAGGDLSSPDWSDSGSDLDSNTLCKLTKPIADLLSVFLKDYIRIQSPISTSLSLFLHEILIFFDNYFF